MGFYSISSFLSLNVIANFKAISIPCSLIEDELS